MALKLGGLAMRGGLAWLDREARTSFSVCDFPSPNECFWSSRMGVTDLGYQGNIFVAEWKGCPESWLQKLGVAE